MTSSFLFLVVERSISYSQLVATNELAITELKDATDAKIIACAIGAKADYIITGDKDLLLLKNMGKLKSLGPMNFWMLFKDEDKPYAFAPKSNVLDEISPINYRRKIKFLGRLYENRNRWYG